MNANQGKPMGCFMRGCVFFILHSLWIGFLIAGLYYAFDSFRLVSSGVEVDSVVVDTDIHNGSDGSTTYSPIFEYTYEGETYRYNSVNSSSNLSHKIGDHVTLVIDPSNPKHARENSFGELWFLPTLLIPISLCLGVFMIVIGALVSRYGKVTSMGSFKVNNG